MKEKEEAEENKCNHFYISDSIGRARIVQQFWIGGGGVGGGVGGGGVGGGVQLS